MEKLTIKSMLAMLIAMSVLWSCQKDQLETASGPVFSVKYTTLTLDDNFDLPNPAASEQFAVRLFDLKEDGDGLTEKELLTLGNPAQNEDLLYALLFVEKYDRDEILWSWLEPKEDENDFRSNNAQWKWTGGQPIASMYASGFKKWPAWKVKNVFQDPCGDVIQAGPVYQACHKLCDGNMPPPCMSDELKKEILEKIIADTPIDPYSVASQLVGQAGWPLLADVDIPTSPVTLMNYERQVISGNIVHYKFQVAVGSGQYDKIGIHRVVKEMAPNVPVVTDKAVFFQHGDAKDFVGMTLPGLYSPNTDDDFGIAFYMAENNLDFWGIDQAWTLVPATTTDFNFMKDWGLEKNFKDLRTAMAIARVARFLTSNNLEKMDLAGYSSGVNTGFALLNHETQLEQALQHADGYMPIDLAVKTNNDNYKNFRINNLQNYQNQLANGMFHQYIPFKLVGQLAKTDPSGNSPVIPAFTNEQTALFFAAGRIWGVVPFHYMAGVFQNNFPVALQFVNNDQWFDFAESAVVYEPTKFFYDCHVLNTDYYDSTFDDFYAQIKIPILNVSPAGGFGALTQYAFTFIGSSDVEHHIPALYPPAQVALDFGHIDIFLANNAETVIWKPMLDWIKAH